MRKLFFGRYLIWFFVRQQRIKVPSNPPTLNVFCPLLRISKKFKAIFSYAKKWTKTLASVTLTLNRAAARQAF